AAWFAAWDGAAGSSVPGRAGRGPACAAATSVSKTSVISTGRAPAMEKARFIARNMIARAERDAHQLRKRFLISRAQQGSDASMVPPWRVLPLAPGRRLVAHASVIYSHGSGSTH